MVAAIYWWALDGCYYLLVDSGWLLLFPDGLWMVWMFSYGLTSAKILTKSSGAVQVGKDNA